MNFKQIAIPEIKDMIKNATKAELEVVFVPSIMTRQTWGETAEEATTEKNGVGLNGCDAKYITSVFKAIRAGMHISDKQATTLRKKLAKYAKQYMEIAAENKARIQCC